MAELRAACTQSTAGRGPSYATRAWRCRKLLYHIEEANRRSTSAPAPAATDRCVQPNTGNPFPDRQAPRRRLSALGPHRSRLRGRVKMAVQLSRGRPRRYGSASLRFGLRVPDLRRRPARRARWWCTQGSERSGRGTNSSSMRDVVRQHDWPKANVRRG